MLPVSLGIANWWTKWATSIEGIFRLSELNPFTDPVDL